VAREVEPVSDDGGLRWRRLDRQLLQPSNACRHRLQDLAVQHAAMRDELMEVRCFESRHARWLGRPNAGDRRRAEEERDFAEVLAGSVRGDLSIVARERLEDGELSFEQREESRRLPLENEPFVGAHTNVRGSRGERRPLGVR